MSVEQSISAALAAIESQYDVRVLFAAESGSRAWGFASPDSDYDVRFIYVHRLDWYLGIGDARDVIEAMLPGELDLSGWELRKTLRQFLRCNLALNEWLGSPIVYRDRDEFAHTLRRLIVPAFRTPAAHHHYLSLAKRKFLETLAQDPVRLKDVFYASRALLACRWVRRTDSQPPTEFGALVAAPDVTESERTMIHDLLAAKALAQESDRAALAPLVRTWLENELDMAAAAVESLRSHNSLTAAPLDELMRAVILKP